MKSSVRFIHISDTHIGTDKSYELLGINTYKTTCRTVEALNALPILPDFIIHTGDIASVDGEPEAYSLAQQIFGKLKVPIYYVSGNHDISENLIKTLNMPRRTYLTDDVNTFNSYFFNLNGIDFIVLDGRGPRNIDPHGIIGENQIEGLKRVLSQNNYPAVIFIHFPLLPLESTWLDRDMLLINGGDIHKILIEFKDKIQGVFSGHVHRGMTKYQDGILYSSVGSTCIQFVSWPGQEQVIFDRQPVGFFNYVSISVEGILIKEHEFPL